MKRIYSLIVFVLLCNAATAQVSLNASDDGSDESTGLTAAQIAGIAMDTTHLVVLPLSDTGLMSDMHSTSFGKKVCILTFIGCDETHSIISDFTNYFYTEYLKDENSETAFFKARAYLLNKYRNCPVTPVLTCRK